MGDSNSDNDGEKPEAQAPVDESPNVPHEKASPEFVVVCASTALGASLQAALRANSKLQVVASESPLEASSQLDPDLMIVEVTERSEAAARALVESNPRGYVVFIGSCAPPLPQFTRNPRLRELSADVSVSEVVRISSQLLHGTMFPTLFPGPLGVAHPSPFQVLPRPSEPPPSVHSLPAPLLPSSAPPSSRPSGPSPMPSIQVLGANLLEEGTPLGPTEYSQELQRILADAERRVLSGLRQRPTAPPLAPVSSEREGLDGEPARLSPELRAALEYPVGSTDTAAGGEMRARTESRSTGAARRVPGSQVPTTVGFAEDMVASRDGATVARLPPPSSYPPSSGHHLTPPAPASSSYPDTPTAKPPPQNRSHRGPTTGQAERTAIELPEVPPAPGLPRGAWLGAYEEETHGHDDFETGDAEVEFPAVARKAVLRPPVARRARRHPPASARPEARITVSPRAHSASTANVTGSSAVPNNRAPAPLDIPPLRKGDSVRVVARAVRERFTGTLTFETAEGVRRIVLRDGDFATAASGITSESLVTFLVKRGVLSHEVEAQLGHKLPSFGRHAGAALIAGGHLAQDQLWPVLRAHAESVVASVLQMREGVAVFEETIPERLQAEPTVFGGATGAEVYVEMLRLLIEPEQAIELLGGPAVQLRNGPELRLLEECALTESAQTDLEVALRYPLGEALPRFSEREFACVLYALMELRALVAEGPPSKPRRQERVAAADPLDAEALRRAVLLRRALVDEGDYFAFLGVPRHATGYAIRSAYLELRRQFATEHGVAATSDLVDDLTLIGEVLDEAYEVLGDSTKRERYLRAIESIPQAVGPMVR